MTNQLSMRQHTTGKISNAGYGEIFVEFFDGAGLAILGGSREVVREVFGRGKWERHDNKMGQMEIQMGK
jgi:hypothetical protein